MKIYFVRHGHPDYENDCLTDKGIKQAMLAAERLKDCGIDTVYSSTRGRAMQTAKFTADKLGLEVIGCDFMREIAWGAINGEDGLPDKTPWDISQVLAKNGISIRDEDWAEKVPFNKTRLVRSVKVVADGLDLWLESLGYKREGDYYRVVGENTNRSVAMFGHGGSFGATLSHLFNVPFPQACVLFGIDFTSVIVVELSDEVGALVYPKLASADDRHLSNINL